MPSTRACLAVAAAVALTAAVTAGTALLPNGSYASSPAPAVAHSAPSAQQQSPLQPGS